MKFCLMIRSFLCFLRLLSFCMVLFITFSCNPAYQIAVQSIDNQKEVPRYCLKKRLFFYEVQASEDKLRIWIQTRDQTTVDLLLNQSLKFYFAEGKIKNIQYFFVVDAAFSSHSQTEDNTFDIRFYKVLGPDTVDMTDQQNISINSTLKDNYYALKLDFPRHVLNSITEPVVGILCQSNNTGVDNKAVRRSSPKTPQINTRNNQSLLQRRSEVNKVNDHLHYHEIEKDIEVWFRLDF